MKVLINAYACSPNMGSEPGMGWNWIVSISRHCEVYVITEGEYKDLIDSTLPTILHGDNIHFYYNPVSNRIHKMCWNQGDWRFYWHYRKWQKKTADMAREICRTHNIDILHQLNMIGFREPGFLADVSKELHIPLVWGPIGGMKQFPMAYASGCREKLFYYIKNLINYMQIRLHLRVRKTIKQAACLISSIPDSHSAIKAIYKKDSLIIPETGCFPNNDITAVTQRFHHNTLNLIWVGKFDSRKRIDIAINAIAKTGNPNIRLNIYGTGNEVQVKAVTTLIRSLRMERLIQLKGSIPNSEIHNIMRQADIFLFTSVNEDTSTVVLEAVSNRLPIICFNTCGMAYVVDDSIGKKISLTNPSQSATDFAKQINHYYNHREKLDICSQNCIRRAEDLSWEHKGLQAYNIYTNIKK